VWSRNKEKRLVMECYMYDQTKCISFVPDDICEAKCLYHNNGACSSEYAMIREIVNIFEDNKKIFTVISGEEN